MSLSRILELYTPEQSIDWMTVVECQSLYSMIRSDFFFTFTPAVYTYEHWHSTKVFNPHSVQIYIAPKVVTDSYLSIYSIGPKIHRVCHGKNNVLYINATNSPALARWFATSFLPPWSVGWPPLAAENRQLSSGSTAQRGVGMSCWKATKAPTVLINLVFAFTRYISLNHVDSSPRSFLMASYRSPSSAGPTVGSQDDWHRVTRSGPGADGADKTAH